MINTQIGHTHAFVLLALIFLAEPAEILRASCWIRPPFPFRGNCVIHCVSTHFFCFWKPFLYEERDFKEETINRLDDHCKSFGTYLHFLKGIAIFARCFGLGSW